MRKTHCKAQDIVKSIMHGKNLIYWAKIVSEDPKALGPCTQ